MRYLKFIFILLSLPYLLSCSSSAGKKTFNEGLDTECEITSWHTVSDQTDYFLKEGDKVDVISPSSLPSPAQRDAVMKGLRQLPRPIKGRGLPKLRVSLNGYRVCSSLSQS